LPFSKTYLTQTGTIFLVYSILSES
jgi:hypothetical protein